MNDRSQEAAVAVAAGACLLAGVWALKTHPLPVALAADLAVLIALAFRRRWMDDDVVPWWFAGLIGVALLAHGIDIRRHPAVALGAQVVAIAATAVLTRTPFITKRFGGRLYGKGTAATTLVAVIAQAAALTGHWQARGWWWLTLPILLVFVARTIGKANTPHRARLNMEQGRAELAEPEPTTAAMRKVLKGMPAFRDAIANLSPAATVEHPTETDGLIRIKVHSPQPLKDGNVLWATARAFALGGDHVQVLDLFADRVGLYEVVIGQQRVAVSFAKPLGPRPSVGEWPTGSLPLGEYGDASTAWVPWAHVLVGATTRAGKTVALENLSWGSLQVRDEVVLVDPKVVGFIKFATVVGVTYASSEADMLRVLRQLKETMDRRYDQMGAAGIDKWGGRRITCVIDESRDLFERVPESKALVATLASKALAAGIRLVIATQRPDRDSVPPIVKANCDVVLGLRVANKTAERVVLDEDAAARGFSLTERTLPAGRGVLRTLDAEDDWVQVYPPPGTVGLARRQGLDVPPAEPTVPAEPAPSAPPYAGPTLVPEVPTELPAEPHHGTDGTDPIATLERRLKAVPDARTTRDLILDNLDPEDEITSVVLAEIVGTSDRNVRNHLANLVDEGLAVRKPKGWVRAA